MNAPVATGGRAVNPAIAELAERFSWVCWRLEYRKGKLTKPPFTPAGLPASAADPSTWSSFDECWRAAFVEGRHDGIGRVLVENERLVGIDLDNACASDGTVAPWANQIVMAFPTYWEISPSGSGLHGWCRGAWPTSGNRRGSIEVYGSKRFLTITGKHVPATPDTIQPMGPALAQLWRASFAGKRGPRDHSPVLPVDLPEAMPADLVASIARTHPQLRRILDGHYPSQSERDLALVRFAKLARWEPRAAWSLVLAVRTDGKADRPDYASRTLALVY
jgi:putative DNA primase/helicase